MLSYLANFKASVERNKTLYFIGDLADRAHGVQNRQSTDGVAV